MDLLLSDLVLDQADKSKYAKAAMATVSSVMDKAAQQVHMKPPTLVDETVTDSPSPSAYSSPVNSGDQQQKEAQMMAYEDSDIEPETGIPYVVIIDQILEMEDGDNITITDDDADDELTEQERRKDRAISAFPKVTNLTGDSDTDSSTAMPMMETKVKQLSSWVKEEASGWVELTTDDEVSLSEGLRAIQAHVVRGTLASKEQDNIIRCDSMEYPEDEMQDNDVIKVPEELGEVKVIDVIQIIDDEQEQAVAADQRKGRIRGTKQPDSVLLEEFLRETTVAKNTLRSLSSSRTNSRPQPRRGHVAGARRPLANNSNRNNKTHHVIEVIDVEEGMVNHARCDVTILDDVHDLAAEATPIDLTRAISVADK